MRKRRFSIPKLHQIIYAEITETSGKGKQAEIDELFFNTKIGMPDKTKILYFGEYSDGWAKGLAQEHKVIFTCIVKDELKKADENGMEPLLASPYLLSSNTNADWMFSFEPAEYYTSQLPVLILKALADARCGLKLAYKEEQPKIEKLFKLAQSWYYAGFEKKIAILSAKDPKHVLRKGTGYRIYTLVSNRKAREIAETDLKVIENLQKVTKGTYDNAIAKDKLDLEEMTRLRAKTRLDRKGLLASLERINTLAEAEGADLRNYGSMLVETEW